MNDEDMSEIIQKLTSMMNDNSNNTENSSNMNNDSDVSSNSNAINEDTLKNLINSFSSGNQSENNYDDNNSNQSNDNGFNFDINTILRMKNIMDKMNSKKNDPRANLLLSLKPYLNNDRKEKLDQYIQFLNISKVFEAFRSDNEAGNK